MGLCCERRSRGFSVWQISLAMLRAKCNLKSRALTHFDTTHTMIHNNPLFRVPTVFQCLCFFSSRKNTHVVDTRSPNSTPGPQQVTWPSTFLSSSSKLVDIPRSTDLISFFFSGRKKGRNSVKIFRDKHYSKHWLTKFSPQ